MNKTLSFCSLSGFLLCMFLYTGNAVSETTTEPHESLEHNGNKTTIARPSWEVGDWWWWESSFVSGYEYAPYPKWSKPSLGKFTVTSAIEVEGYMCYKVNLPSSRNSLYFSTSDLSLMKYETFSQSQSPQGDYSEIRVQPPGVITGPKDVFPGWPVFPLVNGKSLSTMPKAYFESREGKRVTLKEGGNLGYPAKQEIQADVVQWGATKINVLRVFIADVNSSDSAIVQRWSSDRMVWVQQWSNWGTPSRARLIATSQDTLPVDWLNLLQRPELGWQIQKISAVPTPQAARSQLTAYTRAQQIVIQSKGKAPLVLWLLRTEHDDVLNEKKDVQEVKGDIAKGEKTIRRLYKGSNYQVLYEVNKQAPSPQLLASLKAIFTKNPKAPPEPEIPMPKVEGNKVVE